MAPIDKKEWTLMFYLASDSPLAPEVVSQLKSIKQSGFHSEANIVAQFDPSPENVETHVFDINRINKLQSDGMNRTGFIGFKANDPFVVNLMTDKLWGEQTDLNGGLIRDRIIESLKRKGIEFDPPSPPLLDDTAAFSRIGELGPRKSLASFLKLCRDNYPARHYILFILGHGLVVGNDTFLFDENAPEHYLSLQSLGEVLKQFKEDIKKRDGVETDEELELISFHSCSMSSLEVAFELKGIANYMLASQSPAFVGTWPYRQMLIRIFNYLERKENNVKELFTNFFHYCLYNSLDFLVAGYSSDLCLCDLSKVQVPRLQDALNMLSTSLIEGLRSGDSQTLEQVREGVLLAHLDAQSYFNENYVDLFDFCFRLQQRFLSGNQASLPAELKAITRACQEVLEMLRKGVEGDDNGLIVRSDFVGPAYQYAHGLSVYFPWSRPLTNEFWPTQYNEYKFISAFADPKHSWSAFLETYFDTTRRRTRAEEFKRQRAPGYQSESRPLRLQEELLEAFATGMFNIGGLLRKPIPDSSIGENCDCQSIKNYPPFTRERVRNKITNVDEPGKVPVSPTSLRDSTFTLDGNPTFALDGLIE